MATPLSITPSKAPGYYLESQILSFIFSANTETVAYSVNGAPPTISKYIAYDTLTPANPFIAVSEDGRGPVVYDGGFPKLYNTYSPAAGATYDQLSAAHKYIVNAVNYVSNPNINLTKKKVLVLGDAVSGVSYWVKGTANTDFYTTLTRLAAAGNFDIVIKDANDYAGVLNPTLSELQQYNAVMLLSTRSIGGWNYLSSQAVNDLVSYRETYGGLIVVTDHGAVFNTIDAAIANKDGFFGCANKLVTRFGAWFSGNYDRTPVNVGFLRATYGDHPLYANMEDSDSIAAGGSESRVLITNPTLYSRVNFPTISVSNVGQNTVQLLTKDSLGNILTARLVYYIQSGDFLFFKKKADGADVVNDSSTIVAPSQFTLNITTTNLGTVRGRILRNGKRVGGFEAINNVTTLRFANGSDIVDCYDGDVFTVMVTEPFTYTKTISAVRPKMAKPNSVTRTAYTNALRSAQGITSVTLTGLRKSYLTKISPVERAKVEQSTSFDQMLNLVNGGGSLPDLTVEIYETKAQATGYMNSQIPKPYDFVFVVEGNSVYGYDSGIWALLTEWPIEVVGRRRLLATQNAWRPAAITCYFDTIGKLIKI